MIKSEDNYIKNKNLVDNLLYSINKIDKRFHYFGNNDKTKVSYFDEIRSSSKIKNKFLLTKPQASTGTSNTLKIKSINPTNEANKD